MKNSKVFFTAFLLSLCFVLTRCTPDTTGLVPPTEEVLVRNAWSVDYYFHNQDMTNDFGSSRILFSSTGAVGYQRNGETIPGTWTKTVDALNNELITIHFNTTDVNISRLNESWKLTNRSASSLQFEETDGITNILFRIKTQ
jgi:hypothetical protein